MKIQIFVMPARIAGIQGRKDAYGDIHVRLDSSTPCWNETIEGCTKTNRGTPPFLFSKEHTKITKFGTKLVLQKTILTLLRIGHSRKLLSARRDFVQSPPAVTTIAPILQHSVFLTLVPRERDPGFPAPGDRLPRT